MKSKLTGIEFVTQVSSSIGQELKFGKWIALLFDAFKAHNEGQIFADLAFEGKSFQRVKRLLGTGIPDKAVKEKVEAEIGEILKRFSALLERGASYLGSNERKEFHKRFLDPSSSSFDNVTTLLQDFAVIKNFYLKERDTRKRS